MGRGEQSSKQWLEEPSPPRWKCKLVSTSTLPSMDSENVAFRLISVVNVVKIHVQIESDDATLDEGTNSQPRQTKCIACVYRPAFVVSGFAMPQLSTTELATMERMTRKGHEPNKIVASLRMKRARKDESGPSPSSVYKFLAGDTHQRDSGRAHGLRRLTR